MRLPGCENDHVAAAPLKSSNPPVPSRSHANSVIVAPGDGVEVEVNVTVSPTLGVAGEKVNDALGRSLPLPGPPPPGPPPDCALAGSATDGQGERDQEGTP